MNVRGTRVGRGGNRSAEPHMGEKEPDVSVPALKPEKKAVVSKRRKSVQDFRGKTPLTRAPSSTSHLRLDQPVDEVVARETPAVATAARLKPGGRFRTDFDLPVVTDEKPKGRTAGSAKWWHLRSKPKGDRKRGESQKTTAEAADAVDDMAGADAMRHPPELFAVLKTYLGPDARVAPLVQCAGLKDPDEATRLERQRQFDAHVREPLMAFARDGKNRFGEEAVFWLAGRDLCLELSKDKPDVEMLDRLLGALRYHADPVSVESNAPIANLTARQREVLLRSLQSDLGTEEGRELMRHDVMKLLEVLAKNLLLDPWLGFVGKTLAAPHQGPT